MHTRRSRFAPNLSFDLETLEPRIALSGIASASELSQRSVEVAAQASRRGVTQTVLAVSAGTLGQPVTFTVTVRAAAAVGAPVGTVNIVDHGTVIQTLTLSPTTSTNARYAFSQATATLTPQPGGNAYFFGKHAVSAVFVPAGTFVKSSSNKVFNVIPPSYTTLADGVQTATIAHGTGPAIQSGQTASVLYTGYLASNGRIFDDSINDGGAPFRFTLGGGQVIPGFDTGTVGMQVGETRIVKIPPAEGYGAIANGSIPANSTLIFVLTLQSVS